MIRGFGQLAIGALLVAATLRSAAQAPLADASETERLVRAALENSFRSGQFPDIGMLPRDRNVPVVIAEGLLRARALPELPGWRFELRSRADLTAAATREGRNLFYASVGRIRMEGETASLWLGVSFVEPTDRPRRPRDCCCAGQFEYKKVGVDWAYSKMLSYACL